jgi:hypothetical protein
LNTLHSQKQKTNEKHKSNSKTPSLFKRQKKETEANTAKRNQKTRTEKKEKYGKRPKEKANSVAVYKAYHAEANMYVYKYIYMGLTLRASESG